MKLIQKENVQLNVNDEELQTYLLEGFKEVIIIKEESKEESKTPAKRKTSKVEE